MNNSNHETGVGPIGQLALTIGDLDKSVAFYRDTLGLPLLFKAPPAMAFFDCGQVRLMLSCAEQNTTERFSAAIYFKVSDISASHAALAARGVAFVREPHLIARMPDHELWMAFFHDPDRHLLALMCEKRPPVSAPGS